MKSSSHQMPSKNRFYVLLGPDYTGKSTLLKQIKRQASWMPISYDDGMLDHRYEILESLKRDFFRSLAKGRQYSTDFLLAGFQMAIMYLRDRALEGLQEKHVLIDSYYYKILAKCLLKEAVQPAIFDLWRASPAPDRVLLLQGDLELQWQRARRCRRLNPFEYYGDRPTRSGFISFQQDLMQLLIEETKAVPVDLISSQSPDEARDQLFERLELPGREGFSPTRAAVNQHPPPVIRPLPSLS